MDFNKSQQNARMNLDGYNSKPFNLFENLNVRNDKFNNMTGNYQESELSKLYFSQVNVDYIQTQIIKRVYDKTNKQHRVGKQSEDELLIVMRSIYFQHGKNMNTKLDLQVNILNELVLDYCVDNVFSNLKQYMVYIKDISTDQVVMDRPQTTHVKGSKTLMPHHFF